MELQAHYQSFESLNAEIVAIAQEEADASTLTRVERFVKSTFPVVADPEQVMRPFVERYGVFLVDKAGNIRVQLPGTKTARARLDVILRELAWMEGVEPPATRQVDGKTQVADPGESGSEHAVAGVPETVLEVRWMWSHNTVRPGDWLKLAFCPVIADGFHVYAPWETQMSPLSVAIETPPGLAQVTPVAYPESKTEYDGAVDLTLASYKRDIPLATMVFEAADDLTPGELTFRARVAYQACDGRVCLPPTEVTVEMPIEVAPKESRRQQVYGWESW